jgi:radical SAM protein with 4Fe4S-binding SPASM domain
MKSRRQSPGLILFLGVDCMHILRRARGTAVYQTDSGMSVVNGRLEQVSIDSAAASILDLIDGARDSDTIKDLAKKEGILKEKTTEMLRMLLDNGIIVEEGSFWGDERIFLSTWRGDAPDYMKMSALARIHAVQKDSSLQRISVLPPEDGSKKELDIVSVLTQLMKHASKTPIIEILRADMYLDSSQILEMVQASVTELEHDMPHFFFELTRNIFSEEDMKTLLTLTRFQNTQCLSSRTLASRIFGEAVLQVGREFRLSSQDNNISIALRIHATTPEVVEFFRKFPVNVLLVTEIGKNIHSKVVSMLPYSLFLRTSGKWELEAVEEILQSSHIFFWEDDMYRVQRALQKSYLPFTHCGAGTRKIAVTMDGNVYPCADAAEQRKYYLGNLREESIATILEGRRTQNVRENIRETFEKCAEKCPLAYFCSGCIMWKRCNKKREILSLFLQKSREQRNVMRTKKYLNKEKE